MFVKFLYYYFSVRKIVVWLFSKGLPTEENYQSGKEDQTDKGDNNGDVVQQDDEFKGEYSEITNCRRLLPWCLIDKFKIDFW